MTAGMGLVCADSESANGGLLRKNPWRREHKRHFSRVRYADRSRCFAALHTRLSPVSAYLGSQLTTACKFQILAARDGGFHREPVTSSMYMGNCAHTQA
jgi:hypothetical protein